MRDAQSSLEDQSDSIEDQTSNILYEKSKGRAGLLSDPQVLNDIRNNIKLRLDPKYHEDQNLKDIS